MPSQLRGVTLYPDRELEAEGWGAALRRYGLPVKQSDRPAIIAALEEQIRREREAKDQDLMRLLCAQLFSLGVVEDSLLIWRAKECDWDTHCGIDSEFLCGAGLERTKEFLRGAGGDVLNWITECESAGQFAEVSVEQIIELAKDCYKIADPGARADGDLDSGS